MAHLPVPQHSLSTYLAEINQFPLLTPAEEQTLALRLRETGDVEAAHALVTANLRFVVKIAYEYGAYGIRMNDLIQEGNIGLMLAVRKFDPDKGYRLISYAVWWIRAMIQSFILKSWSLVKIGTTQAQRKLFYKLSQTKRTLSKFWSGSDELNESDCKLIADRLNVRGNDVAEMDARLKSRDVSLDQPAFSEGPNRVDLLPSSENQEELLARSQESAQVRTELDKAITTLNDKEKFIVKHRLMTDEPMTLQEIGDRYRISRERARQLEERAKQKIRTVFNQSELARDFQ